MSAIIKAKVFESRHLTFGVPKHIIGSNYILTVLYDGCKLHVQLPRCVVSNSMYELAGKFYLDVMASQESVLISFVRSIAARIGQHLNTLTEYNLHEAVFTDHVTRLTQGNDNEVFCSMRLKLPRQGGQFQCAVTDANGAAKCVTDIRTGSSILCIVSIDNVYSMGGNASFNMVVTDVKIMDGSDAKACL